VKKDVHPDPPRQPDSLSFINEAFWGAVKNLENVKTFEHII
jgi:hypothetical protein